MPSKRSNFSKNTLHNNNTSKSARDRIHLHLNQKAILPQKSISGQSKIKP